MKTRIRLKSLQKISVLGNVESLLVTQHSLLGQKVYIKHVDDRRGSILGVTVTNHYILEAL